MNTGHRPRAEPRYAGEPALELDLRAKCEQYLREWRAIAVRWKREGPRPSPAPFSGSVPAKAASIHQSTFSFIDTEEHEEHPS